MINAALQSKLQDSKIVTMASLTVEVEMKPSSLVSTLAEKLLSELNRVSPYTGYAPVADLEVEDIRKYLNTLVWLRVNHVRGCSDKLVASYRAVSRHLAIPVLMYQLLICIGHAYDKDYNLAFEPVCNFTKDEVLSPDEMEAVSSLLRQFSDSGIKVVFGMPRSEEGELDFMAMCHVEDEVVSYRRSHPVFGFIASFFSQKELNAITGTMCRVVYGYETDFKYQVDALMRAIDCFDSK